MFNKISRFYFLFGKEDINEIVSESLENEMIFNNLLEIASYYYQEFAYLDYELLRELIFKIEKRKSIYKLNFLTMIDIDKQKQLLWENYNDETIMQILNFVEPTCASYFFKNNIRARHLYKKISIPYLVSKGVLFNDDILKNKDFFDNIKSESFVEFRNNINNIERYNNSSFLEDKLNKYYDELINNYSIDYKMFKEYIYFLKNKKIKNNVDKYIFSNDIKVDLINYEKTPEKLIEYFKEISRIKLSEIIIDYLFQDNIYNVWLNINEMIRFNEKVKFLSKDKLNFYKLILNFDNLDNNKKIEIYNKYKYKNYSSIFYEDIRKLKDLSYSMIKDSLLTIEDYKTCYNIIESSKYGVDIYDLRSENYYCLVRNQEEYRPKSNLIRNCYSLISNENNIVFSVGCTNEYIYGYSNIEVDKVLHILELDSYSCSSKEESSKCVNRIMSPEEIVNSCISYSEIQIVNTRDLVEEGYFIAKKPDYLIVFEKVSGYMVKEAKRLEIPIIIISGQILEDDKKINITFNEEQDIYINNKFEERNKKVKRLENRIFTNIKN